GRADTGTARDRHSERQKSQHGNCMNRLPLRSINPNSLRGAEAHTDSRCRQSYGERESLGSPQLDRVRAAARQRTAARRATETDGARAERCVACACRPQRGNCPIAAEFKYTAAFFSSAHTALLYP
ncbi:unnamed protein product, partial [Ectocarpus sp. 8 AP-2014]